MVRVRRVVPFCDCVQLLLVPPSGERDGTIGKFFCGNFLSSIFEVFRSAKTKKTKNTKIISLVFAIERLFGVESWRAAKTSVELVEGRARRRCFPFVPRYPLPGLLLALDIPARS